MRTRTFTFVGLVAAIALPSLAVAALTAPGGLRATPGAGGVVSLSWKDRSARELGFEVERSHAPASGFAKIFTTAKNATSHVDTGLAPGTYYYRVRALARRARATSAYSSVASAVVTGGDVQPPSAPGSLSATPLTCSQATLAWAAATDLGGSGLAAYRIHRNGARVAEVAPTTRSANETNLAPETVYVYQVSAVDGAGNESGKSPMAIATTPACPNQPPTANAGADQSASVLVPVALSGAASTDPDGSIVAHAWAFGDGATGVGPSVSHAYATAGVYTVTLTVTDDRGATASDTARVTITAAAATPWSRSAGSPGDDRAHAVAVDVAGNVAVTGYFSGTVDLGGGPLTSDHLPFLDANNYRDVFVARYTAAGSHRWSRRLGADADDRGNAVAVDGGGNVVVAGNVQNYVDFGDGVITGTEGGFDAFVAKYAAADGAHLWSKRFGTSGIEGAYGVAADASGNVVAVGHFENTIAPAGAPLTSAGGLDVFVVKYGPTGTPLWAKRFGGSAFDYGYGAAFDGTGNVLVVGAFYGSVDFGGGALVSAGGLDVFAAKYGPTGTHLWSKRFGGPLDDLGYGVAADASGNVVLTGSFQGTAGFAGTTLASAGDSDVFVSKLTAAGAHVWSKRFGAAMQDRGQAVAVDASGNVAATGYFQGSVDFGGGVLTSTSIDLFVARLSAAGTHLWSRRFGTTGGQYGAGVAASPAGRLLVTGYHQHAIDLGTGPHTSAGAYDAFVADVGP